MPKPKPIRQQQLGRTTSTFPRGHAGGGCPLRTNVGRLLGICPCSHSRGLSFEIEQRKACSPSGRFRQRRAACAPPPLPGGRVFQIPRLSPPLSFSRWLLIDGRNMVKVLRFLRFSCAEMSGRYGPGPNRGATRKRATPRRAALHVYQPAPSTTWRRMA